MLRQYSITEFDVVRRSDILISKYLFLTKGEVASTDRHVAHLDTVAPFQNSSQRTLEAAPTTLFLPVDIKMEQFCCGTSGMSR